MASENETVAEIREDVHEYLTSIGPGEYPDETQFEEFADRFVAAHKREVEELETRYADACKCCDAFQRDVAELRSGIAELLDTLQSIYDEECYRTDEVYDKWRKFMEGAK